MSINPVTPEDIQRIMAEKVPDYVIESVNELLQHHAKSSTESIEVRQSELWNVLAKRADTQKAENLCHDLKTEPTYNLLFAYLDSNALDFPAVYRLSGWNVTLHYAKSVLVTDKYKHEMVYVFTPAR